MTQNSQLQHSGSERTRSVRTAKAEPLVELMRSESVDSEPQRETPAEPGRTFRFSDASDTTEWTALQLDTLYSRVGRRLFDLSLLAVFGLPALLIGCAIAGLNLVQFRSFSKIFFVQDRVGYRGEVFSILKFRTMGEVRGGNFESWSNGGDQVRVTRIGRLLRNTHLDELPQLINVALGDMAFVGPRPEMVEIEEWASGEIEGFSTRLAIPPGVSGYAQITQGYTTNDVAAYGEKFRVSDWYRRHQSFSLDLKIIAMTLIWMVRGRGWQWNAKGEKPKVELPD
ncbi:MAG: lipopolysaccharide/colanic/teichoic acid biosynthesis glycosyltransferase [Planctomycetota bacterium]|jgi:lipopolysaccharide/colanic/teichoic acid biosynthesis glycosyltransferase